MSARTKPSDRVASRGERAGEPMGGVRSWFRDVSLGWDNFWFAPQTAHTLAVIRIVCGAMLAYVHTIWAVLASDFFGPAAWVDQAAIRQLHASDWAWSWLFYIDSPSIIVAHEVIAVVASMLMMLGCLTRFAIPLAWWLTLMVCHRATGSLFGLDQVVVMLSMYLMLSNCGSVWSVDAWLQDRLGHRRWLPDSFATSLNRVSTRLIQVHLCVIYLFGGLSKMRGEMWYGGSALWYAAVNYEYQSIDITWLGNFRFLIAALTVITIFWETFYCALVWPRVTRPIALGLAVMVHGGIAIALGMVTFGAIMIVANLAFLSPETTRGWIAKLQRLGPSR